MTKIERLTKKRVEVETMLWDGTDVTALAIQEWVGPRMRDGVNYGLCFYPPAASDKMALLWVQHNKDWCSLPVGYRVAKELDGSGFYPLSPEGAAAGYEMPGKPLRVKLHDWYLDASARRYECRDCPAVAGSLEGQEASDDLGCPAGDEGKPTP